VGACGVAGTPDVGYMRSLRHPTPDAHYVPTVVRICRVMPVPVINANVVTIPAIPAGELHETSGGGQHRRTPGGPYVYAQVIFCFEREKARHFLPG